MANMHQLLKAMIEKGASDLHITTGTAPQLRIDGKLHPLRLPPLSPPETKQLCYSVLTDSQKHQFEEKNELDLSFSVQKLSRFRGNVFVQRGHLAFATLHTNSCVQSINRIVDVFPPYQQAQVRAQLSFVLEGVMCQALLPRANGPGRVMSLEVMVPNAAIRNLIREDKIHQIYS